MSRELVWAFGVGMVTTFNPCGFAMLPAYLSYFLGVDAPGLRSARGSVARGLAVGATVSGGFLLTFAAFGLIASHMTTTVYRFAPWLTVVIGAVLVLLGIALAVGWYPTMRLPHIALGGRTRTTRSMVLFGVSYAVASVGCSLPLFLAAIAGSFRQHSVLAGFAIFVAFGAGMGVMIAALTVAFALARHSLVRGVRQVLPYLNRLAGALLVLAGTYVAYYGVLEIRQGAGTRAGFFAQLVWGWADAARARIDEVGASRLGVALGVGLAASLFAVVARRHAAAPATQQRHANAPVGTTPD